MGLSERTKSPKQQAKINVVTSDILSQPHKGDEENTQRIAKSSERLGPHCPSYHSRLSLQMLSPLPI